MRDDPPASPVRAILRPGAQAAYADAEMEQQIAWTEAAGRPVAWTSTGHGPPLIVGGWWMSHLALNWSDPRFRGFLAALGRHRTVIRFDGSGRGLSRSPGGDEPPTVASELTDLDAVVEATGADRVDLLAASSGGPVGIAYAARSPERIRRLVLYGTYAAGREIAEPNARQAVVNLVREHWGLGSRALADLFIPSATADERASYVAFQREAGSAELAASWLAAVYRYDVTDLLAAVTVPVTVLHRRDDRAIPFRLSEQLAREIPTARLTPLDGSDHLPWFGDSSQVAGAVLHALGVPARAVPDRVVPAGLTGRELEVLRLVAAGDPDPVIAARLVVSPHTVHRHVANILGKLEVSSRSAAVARAGALGLL